MRTIVDSKKSSKRNSDSISNAYTPAGDYSSHLAEIQQSIARRAYQLFEDRGCVDGQDLEDWLHAESDVLLQISFSIDDLDNRLIARAEVPLPTADGLEVQVQEQRIIICDRGPIHIDDRPDGLTFRRVFHTYLLPQPVDWASAQISFRDGILEVTAPKLNGDDYVAAA